MGADESRVYIKEDMEVALEVPFASGTACVYTRGSPEPGRTNEDAAALIPYSATQGILAVADGFGGAAQGEEAASRALKALKSALTRGRKRGDELRDAVLDGFEKANRSVIRLGVGAASTLSVVEVGTPGARSYHVGDSLILVVGQRGRVKLQTISHSPVGYGIEAGLIDAKAALHHAERHLVSNMVGSAHMRIEVGTGMKLTSRDTVLVASDGLHDNVHMEEIIHVARKGAVGGAVAKLARIARDRMREPQEGFPSKPDDIALIAYRPTSSRARRGG